MITAIAIYANYLFKKSFHFLSKDAFFQAKKYSVKKYLLSVFYQLKKQKKLFYQKLNMTTFLFRDRFDIGSISGEEEEVQLLLSEYQGIERNIHGNNHRYMVRTYRKFAQAYRVFNKIDIARRIEQKTLEIEKKLAK